MFRAYIKDAALIGATTIALKKLPISYTDILLSGDTIGIEHEEATVEYIVSGNYTSDSSGEISSVTLTTGLTYAITSTHIDADVPVQVPGRRDLTSDVRTAVSAENAICVHFMEYQFSGGTQLLNTSVHNLPMMNPELGTPKVDGASQTGTTLNTKDWIASTKVLRHGDKFTVDSVEYTIDTTSAKVTVDDCEDSALWNEFNKTKKSVTITTSGVYREDGVGNSIRFVVETDCKKRKLIGYRNLSSAKDYSKYEKVRFWVRTNVDIKAGDFKLVFSTKNTCKNIIEYIPIPEMSANSSTVVDMEFYDETVMTSIKSIGIMLFRILPAQTTIWIDNIQVYSNWIKTETSGNAAIKLTSSLSPSPANNTLLKRTWIGFGGALNFEQIEESTDLKANRVTQVLSGVDQSFISIILAQNYIGRYAKIFRAHFDSNYKIMSDPIILFWGYMNGGFEISEQRGEEGDSPKTVEIRMELQDRISSLDRVKGIQTNPESLNQYFPDDGFFDLVAEHVNKTVVWGKYDKPDSGGMCVLATSCLKHKGLMDDCRELQILRKFRDEVLAKTLDGRKLIAGYYKIVNRLVKEIEMEERFDLYEKIYKDIREAVAFIENGDKKNAIRKYYDIINPLKEEFI